MGYGDQHRQGFSAMLSRWTEESAVLRKKLEHEEVGICRYVYQVLGTLTLRQRICFLSLLCLVLLFILHI